jgi:rare lipoprotein A
MLTSTIQALGNVTQSRTALAIFAATLMVGGSVTEASARSYRHHHYSHRHYHHHASNAARVNESWRDTNASVSPSSGTGRTFSGIASFYGNESGSKTASGQRFTRTP